MSENNVYNNVRKSDENIKNSYSERMKEITDSIETGIKDLFSSGNFAEYLKVMAKFHTYSVNNQMLIYTQRPDATRVAGFEAWKNKFGRYVSKGEKGIKIIAPVKYKKIVEESRPDNAESNSEANQPEKKEIEVRGYKIVTVFDIKQTYGKPLPTIVKDLEGNVEHYEAFMEALRRTSDVEISFKKMKDSTDGFFNSVDKKIFIREGMSEVQTIATVIHELAHSKLHGKENDNEHKSREQKEVEAESIAYAVCQYYGIDTSDNSFGYIASWSSGKELKELKESLQLINKTCAALIESLENNFISICEERGVSIEGTYDGNKSVLHELNELSENDRYVGNEITPLRENISEYAR